MTNDNPLPSDEDESQFDITEDGKLVPDEDEEVEFEENLTFEE